MEVEPASQDIVEMHMGVDDLRCLLPPVWGWRFMLLQCEAIYQAKGKVHEEQSAIIKKNIDCAECTIHSLLSAVLAMHHALFNDIVTKHHVFNNKAVVGSWSMGTPKYVGRVWHMAKFKVFWHIIFNFVCGAPP